MITEPKLYQTPPARLVEVWGPTLRYWMRTEVHAYALSVAASVLLSFFPFLIVMLSICKYALAWPAAVTAIYLAMGDFFPGELTDFLRRNLNDAVEKRGPFQVVPVLLLLVTANGVFVPFEVALNRAWGVGQNRSYFKNQLVSLGLIFVCGGLALASITFTAMHREWLPGWISPAAFKVAALPLTILALALMYWLLPNCKISPVRVIPVSIVVGLALELLKYATLLAWPFVRDRLRGQYGPFYISVTILLWSFLAAMVVLAGAEWSARRVRREVIP
ncbi:MAG: YihY/virulence factor BrkB family protein [Bryobacteraceae bacterium]